MIMSQAEALHVRWNLSRCIHRKLTLKGRYLRWKGIDLKRSLERYTCDACGKPIVCALKAPVSQ